MQGLSYIDDLKADCESCVMGKHSRASFPDKAKWRAKARLQLVHTDICGKMSVPSLGGHFYFLTFIDDFFRKCWVYLLKEKTKAFQKFMIFKAAVEAESGCKIQTLRSD